MTLAANNPRSPLLTWSTAACLNCENRGAFRPQPATLHRHPHAQALADLVAYPPEHGALLRLGAGGCRRVVETPVNPFVVARKGRAIVARTVADRDDIVE
jgi:hypothetical protein